MEQHVLVTMDRALIDTLHIISSQLIATAGCFLLCLHEILLNSGLLFKEAMFLYGLYVCTFGNKLYL